MPAHSPSPGNTVLEVIVEQDYLKLRWQKAIISEQGPEKTTRLVLLVLSIFMDMDGMCFPSTVIIAKAAKISERCVCEHLEKANKAGWIKKMVAGHSGQGWKRHKYSAVIPDKALTEGQHVNDKGTDPDDIKALTEGQSNIPIEHTKEHTKSSMLPANDLFLNIPLKDGTEYSIFKKDINAWQESFPSLDVAQELRSLRQWNIDNPKKQKTRAGFRRHVTGWLIREIKKQKEKYNATSIQNTGKSTTEPGKYDGIPELVVEV